MLEVPDEGDDRALTARPHLPVPLTDRAVRAVIVDGKPTMHPLPADVAARHDELVLRDVLEWRCPGRGSRKGQGALHVHQVRRERWQAFLAQRRAEGRELDDVLLGVDV